VKAIINRDDNELWWNRGRANEKNEICKTCDGLGLIEDPTGKVHRLGSDEIKCPHCGGTGVIKRAVQQSPTEEGEVKS